MNTDFFKIEFLENSLENYFFFIGSLLVGLIFKNLISNYLSQLLFKVLNINNEQIGQKKFDNLLTKPISFCVLLTFLYVGSTYINFPESWGLADKNKFGIQMIIKKGLKLIYIYSVFSIVLKLIEYIGLILYQRSSETESKMDDQLVPFIIEIAKILAITLTIFIVLGKVFDINVTALATGLGIGGIALAMASKESLENLLGSFTIFFDRPFTVGDVVTVGSVTGSVEKVGFRSTRIRTFDKSVVTVPNKKMIDAELDNLGERPVRRVKFYVGLTYDTSAEKIKKIVNEIQIMINEHEKTNQDGKVRFQEFGSSSLDILVVYFVDSPRWDDLIDVKEDINYKIMEIVKKHGSDFAFPSTTVYLQK